MLGRDFSVFNRGVRTYNSRINIETDDSFRHPVASPAKIESWDGYGAEAFEDFIVSQAIQRSTAQEFTADIPSFAKIYEFALEQNRAGEEGDECKVPWRKRNRFLDMHLKGNCSREARYCFRLYYFWDEESRQVVVGSFPAHLSTRVS